MKISAKLFLAVVVFIMLVGIVQGVSSTARSKAIIQNLLRHDATLPTNPQLAEIGNAFLYHPASGPIITLYLTQQSLVLNPADPSVLEDIGTLSGDPPVFMPANAVVKNQYKATVHRRNIRKYHIDAVRAYRLRTSNAPALPLRAARASVISTAESDAAVIVGDDANDPES